MSKKLRNSLRLQDFLGVLLPGILLLLVMLYTHYNMTIEKAQHLMQQQARTTTELTRQLMQTRLREMIADVQLLADYVSMGQPDSLAGRQRLTERFLQMARHKPDYDQLRFLDAGGMEVVRVNNRAVPEAVPPAELQHKGRRYYVLQSLALLPGEIYISRFDLNMEQGRVDHNTPTLRASARVSGIGGAHMGIVVLNLNGNHLIEQVWGDVPIAADAIALVSESGYSLIRPAAQDNRVEFHAANPLQQNAPMLWQRLDASDEGVISHDGQHFAFATLSIMGARGNDRWKIFTIQSNQPLQAARQQFLMNNLPLYGLLGLALLLGTWLNARHRSRHQQVEASNLYERSFRLLLEQISLAAVSLDERGKVRFCNDHFVALSGYSREQILGQDWIELFVPAARQVSAWQWLQQTFNQGDVAESGPTLIVTANQQLRTLSWTVTLQRDADDEVIQLSLVGEDITEQLEAQKELRQLSQAVEQSANTVMMTNPSGLITYVNPAFCRLTGYSAEEVQGKRPSLLKSGHTSDEAYQQLWRTLANGETWQGEFHNRKKNGELFWEQAWISPVRDSNGRALSYVAIKQDITEQKRLQTQLAEETRERAANEQLAAVGRMASMVAHDLRNPLSSIKLSLQMTCRREALDPEIQELCQISLEQTRQMEAILENMLTYARPDDLKPQWLDINPLLEQVINSQLRLIADRDIQLQRDFAPRLPTLYADPIRLGQAIQNLLVNAIDATLIGGQPPLVQVSTRLLYTDHGVKLQIAIRNSGATIDPCLCEKVFEPFFTTRARGTGLGLAIVKRLVEQHCGKVSLAPLESQGSCATIVLPLAGPDAQQDVSEGHATGEQVAVVHPDIAPTPVRAVSPPSSDQQQYARPLSEDMS